MMSSPMGLAPFSRAVVNAMRRLYPERLADKSFDNTGLLLEAPFDPSRRLRNSVLLTIDLTKAVADEAINRKDSIIVAYHPIIFRGLKSLTFGDTQQQSLLRLAAAGISVYCPHTAVDSVQGGLADWLADIVTGTPSNSKGEKESVEQASSKAPTSQVGNPPRPTYMLQHHPSQLTLNRSALTLGGDRHKRYPIQAAKVEGYPGAGMGRIVRFSEAMPLTDIIDRIGLGLGNPKGFPVAVPQGKQPNEMTIRSIGICAGSGGHLFSEMKKAGEDVDLLFTGELSHHEALAAIEKGKCVICLFHSNTERGFLHSVLKGQLEDAVGKEWARIRQESAEADGADINISVSEVDRDPFGIMISKSE
ncbi:NGG1p interacting factor 3 [Piedraia hortae CBS 480.64]|uniref:NGG1p interacting factor 3 n=1 Tax=Piedraia hortae CBS 480.64 TaxID=1314780 RepID=A0A6A7C6E1_9PEZI|nr:NGG1p interacting factor 3 [Piedraia hortae CBS 480.64]